jgi:hypothetical protein
MRSIAFLFVVVSEAMPNVIMSSVILAWAIGF